MSWLPIVVPFFVAVALLLLPGMIVLIGAGVPRRLWGAAPAISVGIVAGSAVLWGFAGASWSLLSVVFVTLAALVIVVLINGRLPRVRDGGAVMRTYLPIGLVVLAFGLFAFWRMYVSAVPGPNAIGQLQDTMFHIDVVRYILEHHDGSSLHTGLMDGSANASGFYPAGWHDVAALVVASTGVSIPIAASAVTAALTIVVFPLSSMTLAAVVFRGSPWMLAGVGIAAQLFGAFPWRFLSWGQLYSNMMAMSLLPAVIAILAASALNWRTTRWRARTSYALLALVSVAATALAQPNTVFALFVAGYFFALSLIGSRRPAAESARHRGLRTALLVTMVTFAFGIVWTALYFAPFLQRTVTWVWPHFETPAQAAGEVLAFGFNGGVGQPVLAALAVIGAVIAVRAQRETWWMAATALTFGGLYVLAAGLSGGLRDFLTGFWYHDSYRLAALVGMFAVPFVGIALHAGGRWVAVKLRSRGLSGLSGATLAAGMVVVVAVGVSFGPGASQQREWISQSFKTSDAWMLAPDERAFLSRVSQLVLPGEVVANNPYDGSGLGYGLFGIDMLFPAMDGNWLGTWDPQKKVISSTLTTSGFSPDLCAALSAQGVRYLLQLHNRPYSANGELPEWAGLRVTGEQDGFEPVLLKGDMGLYRITGCS